MFEYFARCTHDSDASGGHKILAIPAVKGTVGTAASVGSLAAKGPPITPGAAEAEHGSSCDIRYPRLEVLEWGRVDIAHAAPLAGRTITGDVML